MPKNVKIAKISKLMKIKTDIGTFQKFKKYIQLYKVEYNKFNKKQH